MRKSDYLAAGAVLAGIGLFLCMPGFLDGFINLTKRFPYCMSFAKFAVLATFGECIGLRIAAGVYNRPGFGLLPRALVWGLLGLGIKLSFTVYATGMPNVLREIGFALPAGALQSGPFAVKLLICLAISVGMNAFFAPVFMTAHKVTDAHILATGGTLKGFFTPIDVTRRLGEINWASLWGFVFKKTLPFFWVPAHTVTFLLPAHFQVLFAALLGIVLGIILAVAARK
jgi:hypothetical protein